jgi:hypothetical protein
MTRSDEKDAEAEDLGKESAYEGTTEFKRRLRRGDESKGDPDERDIAGDYVEDSSNE